MGEVATLLKTKLDDTEEIALETYVHTPTEAQTAFVNLAGTIYGTSGISAGSQMLDYFLYPNRPGWVRIWIARPGELKSTMLRIIARTEALRLVREGLTDKHYVAFISYEEAVDQQELAFQIEKDYSVDDFWSGRVHRDQAIASSISRTDLPIWWFGDSMMKSSSNTAPMTINMCLAGIGAVEKKFSLTPSLILLDYVQEIRVEREGGERRQKIIDATGDVIRLGTLLKCPIEMGSQAKKTSLDRFPPIPQQGDSEYSFYPEQKAQQVVGSWRVWNTHREDRNLQAEGLKLDGWVETIPMHENLTVLRSSKSRYSKMLKAVPVLIDPPSLTITDVRAIVPQFDDMVRRSLLKRGQG